MPISCDLRETVRRSKSLIQQAKTPALQLRAQREHESEAQNPQPRSTRSLTVTKSQMLPYINIYGQNNIHDKYCMCRLLKVKSSVCVHWLM